MDVVDDDHQTFHLQRLREVVACRHRVAVCGRRRVLAYGLCSCQQVFA